MDKVQWYGVLAHVLIGLFMIAVLIGVAWTAISSVPHANYHKHTDECYFDSKLVCGKADGELYWTEPIVPSPSDVLEAIKERACKTEVTH